MTKVLGSSQDTPRNRSANAVVFERYEVAENHRAEDEFKTWSRLKT